MHGSSSRALYSTARKTTPKTKTFKNFGVLSSVMSLIGTPCKDWSYFMVP
jgi:hypothetical protein